MTDLIPYFTVLVTILFSVGFALAIIEGNKSRKAK
jgi:hypothetical protein